MEIYVNELKNIEVCVVDELNKIVYCENHRSIGEAEYRARRLYHDYEFDDISIIFDKKGVKNFLKNSF